MDDGRDGAPALGDGAGQLRAAQLLPAAQGPAVEPQRREGFHVLGRRRQAEPQQLEDGLLDGPEAGLRQVVGARRQLSRPREEPGQLPAAGGDELPVRADAPAAQPRGAEPARGAVADGEGRSARQGAQRRALGVRGDLDDREVQGSPEDLPEVPAQGALGRAAAGQPVQAALLAAQAPEERFFRGAQQSRAPGRVGGQPARLLGEAEDGEEGPRLFQGRQAGGSSGFDDARVRRQRTRL